MQESSIMICPQRTSGQATLLELGQGVAGVLAPLMPHLSEEMALCCPALRSPNQSGWYCSGTWLAEEEDKFVTVLEGLKEGAVRGKVAKPAEAVVVLEVGEEWRGLVERLADPEKEIGEVLGVLDTSLMFGGTGSTQLREVRIGEGSNCLRCRRLLAAKGEELCARCATLVT